LAQAAGIAVLRLANADVIPFAYTNLSETVKTYATELQKLRDSRAKDIAERKKQIADGLFGIVSDPHAPTTAPHVDSLPPQFNFAPLLNAVEALSAAAAEFDKAYAAWRDKPPVMQASAATNATKLASVNERLVKAERAFLLADGLKNRPWFKHSLYAPGFYTGYGVKTVPGVRESLEQGTWQDVDGEIARVAATIQREASLVRQAATDLASVR
jgi:N-acetylated-alpha-linked acidic dipeptidase